MSDPTETRRVRQLHVVYSPGKPSAPMMPLEGAALIIGREPGVTTALRLDDGEVSRRHAEARPSGDRWEIADLGSRNGTIVDGDKVARQELVAGTVVRIGRTLLVYSEVDTSPSEPLARETASLRGPSLVMQKMRGQLRLVAPRPTPVLVLGETGTGKEVVARELHEASGRAGPFLLCNCAAIQPHLAEEALFGAAGLFVAADGGTLFLDGIGALPADLQPRLLRALALGEIGDRTVDVRVIAAAPRNLSGAVADGSFRADLYARLAGWVLDLPPLRARREDVLWLARGFLDREGRRLDLSAGAAEALLLHGWPYNVRELEQVMAAAAARAVKTTVLRAEHLPPEIARPVAVRRAKAEKAPAADKSPDELGTRRWDPESDNEA